MYRSLDDFDSSLAWFFSSFFLLQIYDYLYMTNLTSTYNRVPAIVIASEAPWQPDSITSTTSSMISEMPNLI